jgi:hypothetical protein
VPRWTGPHAHNQTHRHQGELLKECSGGLQHFRTWLMAAAHDARQRTSTPRPDTEFASQRLRRDRSLVVVPMLGIQAACLDDQRVGDVRVDVDGGDLAVIADELGQESGVVASAGVPLGSS